MLCMSAPEIPAVRPRRLRYRVSYWGAWLFVLLLLPGMFGVPGAHAQSSNIQFTLETVTATFFTGDGVLPSEIDIDFTVATGVRAADGSPLGSNWNAAYVGQLMTGLFSQSPGLLPGQSDFYPVSLIGDEVVFRGRTLTLEHPSSMPSDTTIYLRDDEETTRLTAEGIELIATARINVTNRGDCANDISTHCAIAIGESRLALLPSFSDVDLWRLDIPSGTYIVSIGAQTQGGRAMQGTLLAEDISSAPIAIDDEFLIARERSGTGQEFYNGFSIEQTLTGGTYYVRVGFRDGGSPDPYTLSADASRIVTLTVPGEDLPFTVTADLAISMDVSEGALVQDLVIPELTVATGVRPPDGGELTVLLGDVASASISYPEPVMSSPVSFLGSTPLSFLLSSPRVVLDGDAIVFGGGAFKVRPGVSGTWMGEVLLSDGTDTATVGTVTLSLTAARDDCTNSIATDCTIAIGESRAGHLYGQSDSAPNQDYWRLDVPAKPDGSLRTLIIYTQSDIDTRFTATDSTGLSLSTADNDETGRVGRLNFSVSIRLAAGTYYLQVIGGSDSAAGAVGPYRLRVDEDELTLNRAPTFTPVALSLNEDSDAGNTVSVPERTLATAVRDPDTDVLTVSLTNPSSTGNELFATTPTVSLAGSVGNQSIVLGGGVLDANAAGVWTATLVLEDGGTTPVTVTVGVVTVSVADNIRFTPATLSVTVRQGEGVLPQEQELPEFTVATNVRASNMGSLTVSLSNPHPVGDFLFSDLRTLPQVSLSGAVGNQMIVMSNNGFNVIDQNSRAVWTATVLLSDSGASTVATVTVGVVTIDIFRPDDCANDISTHCTIAPGESRLGNLFGFDTDLWRLDIPSGTHVVTISTEITGTSGSHGSQGTLLTEDITAPPVATDNSEDAVRDFTIEQTLIGGTYYVRVGGIQSVFSARNYTLHVEGTKLSDIEFIPETNLTINMDVSEGALLSDLLIPSLTVATSVQALDGSALTATLRNIESTPASLLSSSPRVTLDGDAVVFGGGPFKVAVPGVPGVLTAEVLLEYGDRTTSPVGTVTINMTATVNNCPDMSGSSSNDCTIAIGETRVGYARNSAPDPPLTPLPLPDFWRLDIPAKADGSTSRDIVIFTEGDVDMIGTLYNAAGVSIGENDDQDFINKNFLIEATLEAGTYYLQVRKFSSATEEGPYRLRVLEIGGSDLAGNIRFTPETLSTIAVLGDGAPSFDIPPLTVASSVYAVDGSELAVNLAGQSSNDGLIFLSPPFVGLSGAVGNQSITIGFPGANFGALTNDNWTVTVLLSSADAGVGVGVVTVSIRNPGDCPDTTSTHCTIAVGETKVARIEGNDIDLWRLNVPSGTHVVTISTSYAVTGGNKGTLLSADITADPIATDNTEGVERGFTIVQTLTGGTYYVRVEGYESLSSIDPYALHVEQGVLTGGNVQFITGANFVINMDVSEGALLSDLLIPSLTVATSVQALDGSALTATLRNIESTPASLLSAEPLVTLDGDAVVFGGGPFKVAMPGVPGVLMAEVLLEYGGGTSPVGTVTINMTAAVNNCPDMSGSSSNDCTIAIGETRVGYTGVTVARLDIVPDFWRLDIPAREDGSTSPRTIAIYTEGAVDMVGTLYDAAGSAISMDDDSGEHLNFSIETVLGVGTYSIQAIRHSTGFDGPYRLKVDEFVPSTSRNIEFTVATLSFTADVGDGGTLLSVPPLTVATGVRARNGSALTAFLSGRSASEGSLFFGTPTVRLSGAVGSQEITIDLSGADYQPSGEWTATVGLRAGTDEVLVGVATLSLTNLGDCPDTTSTHCTIAIGETKFARIESDDTDLWRLDVPAGTRVVTISTSHSGSGGKGTLLAADITADPIATDNTEGAVRGFTIVQTLTGGTYYVRVERNRSGINSVNAYTLYVQEETNIEFTPATLSITVYDDDGALIDQVNAPSILTVATGARDLNGGELTAALSGGSPNELDIFHASPIVSLTDAVGSSQAVVISFFATLDSGTWTATVLLSNGAGSTANTVTVGVATLDIIGLGDCANDISTHCTIAIGESRVAHESGMGVDLWRLDIPAGTYAVTIRSENLDVVAGGKGTLLAADITADPIATDNVNELIDFTITETLTEGTYYVRVGLVRSVNVIYTLHVEGTRLPDNPGDIEFTVATLSDFVNDGDGAFFDERILESLTVATGARALSGGELTASLSGRSSNEADVFFGAPQVLLTDAVDSSQAVVIKFFTTGGSDGEWTATVLLSDGDTSTASTVTVGVARMSVVSVDCSDTTSTFCTIAIGESKFARGNHLDVDLWRLDIPEGTHAVTIRSESAKTATGVRGTLLSADITADPIAMDNTNEIRDFAITQTLAEGTYYVRTSLTHMRVATSYTLHVEGRRLSDNIEFTLVTLSAYVIDGDGPLLSERMLESLTVATGARALSGGELTASLSGRSSNELDLFFSGPRVSLTDAVDSSQAVVINFFAAYGNEMGEWTATVLLSDGVGSTASTVTVGVARVDVITPDDCPDTTSTHCTIAIGESRHAYSGTDADLWRLDIPAGTHAVTIRSEGPNAVVGNQGTLLSADITADPIAMDTHSMLRSFTIIQTLAEGTYYVRVRHSIPGIDSADYTLHVEGRRLSDNIRFTPVANLSISINSGDGASWYDRLVPALTVATGVSLLEGEPTLILTKGVVADGPATLFEPTTPKLVLVGDEVIWSHSSTERIIQGVEGTFTAVALLSDSMDTVALGTITVEAAREDCPDNIATTSCTIAVGEVRTGFRERFGSDMWQLDVPADVDDEDSTARTVFIYSGSRLNLQATLLDAAGMSLAFNDNKGNDGFGSNVFDFAITNQVLTVGETYYLRVRAVNGVLPYTLFVDGESRKMNRAPAFDGGGVLSLEVRAVVGDTLALSERTLATNIRDYDIDNTLTLLLDIENTSIFTTPPALVLTGSIGNQSIVFGGDMVEVGALGNWVATVAVSDGTAAATVGTVTLRVREPNDPPAYTVATLSAMTDEDMPTVFGASTELTVATGVSDADGDMLTVSLVGRSSNERALFATVPEIILMDNETLMGNEIVLDGGVLAANAHGVWTATVELSDGGVTVAVGVVTVSVRSVNDVPQATPETVVVNVAETDAAVPIPPATVATNVFDVDGDVLTLRLTNAGFALGTVNNAITGLFDAEPTLTLEAGGSSSEIVLRGGVARADANGEWTATAELSDGIVTVTLETVTVSVTPTPDPITYTPVTLSVDVRGGLSDFGEPVSATMEAVTVATGVRYPDGMLEAPTMNEVYTVTGSAELFMSSPTFVLEGDNLIMRDGVINAESEGSWTVELSLLGRFLNTDVTTQLVGTVTVSVTPGTVPFYTLSADNPGVTVPETDAEVPIPRLTVATGVRYPNILPGVVVGLGGASEDEDALFSTSPTVTLSSSGAPDNQTVVLQGGVAKADANGIWTATVSVGVQRSVPAPRTTIWTSIAVVTVSVIPTPDPSTATVAESLTLEVDEPDTPLAMVPLTVATEAYDIDGDKLTVSLTGVGFTLTSVNSAITALFDTMPTLALVRGIGMDASTSVVVHGGIIAADANGEWTATAELSDGTGLTTTLGVVTVIVNPMPDTPTAVLAATDVTVSEDTPSPVVPLLTVATQATDVDGDVLAVSLATTGIGGIWYLDVMDVEDVGDDRLTVSLIISESTGSELFSTPPDVSLDTAASAIVLEGGELVADANGVWTAALELSDDTDMTTTLGQVTVTVLPSPDVPQYTPADEPPLIVLATHPTMAVTMADFTLATDVLNVDVPSIPGEALADLPLDYGVFLSLANPSSTESELFSTTPTLTLKDRAIVLEGGVLRAGVSGVWTVSVLAKSSIAVDQDGEYTTITNRAGISVVSISVVQHPEYNLVNTIRGDIVRYDLAGAKNDDTLLSALRHTDTDVPRALVVATDFRNSKDFGDLSRYSFMTESGLSTPTDLFVTEPTLAFSITGDGDNAVGELVLDGTVRGDAVGEWRAAAVLEVPNIGNLITVATVSVVVSTRVLVEREAVFTVRTPGTMPETVSVTMPETDRFGRELITMVTGEEMRVRLQSGGTDAASLNYTVVLRNGADATPEEYVRDVVTGEVFRDPQPADVIERVDVVVVNDSAAPTTLASSQGTGTVGESFSVTVPVDGGDTVEMVFVLRENRIGRFALTLSGEDDAGDRATYRPFPFPAYVIEVFRDNQPPGYVGSSPLSIVLPEAGAGGRNVGEFTLATGVTPVEDGQSLFASVSVPSGAALFATPPTVQVITTSPSAEEHRVVLRGGVLRARSVGEWMAAVWMWDGAAGYVSRTVTIGTMTVSVTATLDAPVFVETSGAELTAAVRVPAVNEDADATATVTLRVDETLPAGDDAANKITLRVAGIAGDVSGVSVVAGASFPGHGGRMEGTLAPAEDTMTLTLPNGASLVVVTLTASLPEDTGGDATVTLAAGNTAGYARARIEFSWEQTNDAPVITPIVGGEAGATVSGNSWIVTVDEDSTPTGIAVARITDADGDEIQVSLFNQGSDPGRLLLRSTPAELIFDEGVVVLSVTPAPDANGEWTATLGASDGVAEATRLTLTVIVAPVADRFELIVPTESTRVPPDPDRADLLGAVIPVNVQCRPLGDGEGATEQECPAIGVSLTAYLAEGACESRPPTPALAQANCDEVASSPGSDGMVSLTLNHGGVFKVWWSGRNGDHEAVASVTATYYVSPVLNLGDDVVVPLNTRVDVPMAVGANGGLGPDNTVAVTAEAQGGGFARATITGDIAYPARSATFTVSGVSIGTASQTITVSLVSVNTLYTPGRTEAYIYADRQVDTNSVFAAMTLLACDERVDSINPGTCADGDAPEWSVSVVARRWSGVARSVTLVAQRIEGGGRTVLLTEEVIEWPGTDVTATVALPALSGLTAGDDTALRLFLRYDGSDLLMRRYPVVSQEVISSEREQSLFTPPGQSLRLGRHGRAVNAFNLAGSNAPAGVTNGPPGYREGGVAAIYDYEIELPQGVTVARIAIPLPASLPSDATMYMHRSGGIQWTPFVATGRNDALYSAPGPSCPSPNIGAFGWTEGLVAGHRCVLMVLSDNGANDDDDLNRLNNLVIGTAAIGGAPPLLTVDRTPGTLVVQSGGGGGGGAFGLPACLFLLLIVFSYLIFPANVRTSS